jgi:hypothetical protein
MSRRFHFQSKLESAPAEIVTKDDGSQVMHVPIASLVGDTVLNWYLVPTQAMALTVSNWIGKPVTINHPPDDDEEAVAFLNDDANVIGRIIDSKIVNGKLVHMAELPYPGDTASKKAITAALLGGTIMEVSTGYFAWPEDREGSVQGRSFTQVHHDIAPDHLAILPNGLGACSVAAGCGTLRANSMTTARRPVFNGIETAAQPEANLAAFVAAWNARNPDAQIADGTAVAEMPAEARTWMANHTILGDAGATDAADLLAFPVVNPATGALNRAALVACLSNRIDHAALGRDRRQNLRAMAKELLGNFVEPTANAAVTTNAELDLEDRVRLVSRAIWERWAPGDDDDLSSTPWPFVQHVYDDHAIFEQGASTYRVNYSLAQADGIWTAAIGDRVRGSMEFVAAANDASESTGSKILNFFRRLAGSTTSQENEMQRNELIAKVAGILTMTPERAGLAFANAKDCELQKIIENHAAESEKDAADEVKATANQETATTTPAPVTREQMLQAFPEIAALLAQNQARETSIRNAAKAKAQALGLSEADIDATPVGVLERLVRQPAFGDFSAANGGDPYGFEHSAHEEDVEFRPSDVAYAGPTNGKVQ